MRASHHYLSHWGGVNCNGANMCYLGNKHEISDAHMVCWGKGHRKSRFMYMAPGYDELKRLYCSCPAVTRWSPALTH